MGEQNPNPNPNPDPTQIPTRPEDDHIQFPPDPLLDSNTFILDGDCPLPLPLAGDGDGDTPLPAPAAAEVEVEAPVEEPSNEALALPVTPVATKKSKRDPEEMAERPSWLPEDWTLQIRMRTSGATAGTYDRYYITPTGKRFRSKTEVLHFLETGTTKKKKITDGMPPASSEKPKAKKPKRQKGNFSGVDFDFKNPPQNVSWTLTNASHDIWMPVADEGLVQEHVKKTWDDAFSCITELEGKK